jgi:hypothetical protein
MVTTASPSNSCLPVGALAESDLLTPSRDDEVAEPSRLIDSWRPQELRGWGESPFVLYSHLRTVKKPSRQPRGHREENEAS